MSFYIGQRVKDKWSEGTVTKISTTLIWAIWDDTKKEESVAIGTVKPVSKFKVGDTVQLGETTVTILENSAVSKDLDQKGVLVSRKNLI